MKEIPEIDETISVRELIKMLNGLPSDMRVCIDYDGYFVKPEVNIIDTPNNANNFVLLNHPTYTQSYEIDLPPSRKHWAIQAVRDALNYSASPFEVIVFDETKIGVKMYKDVNLSVLDGERLQERRLLFLSYTRADDMPTLIFEIMEVGQ